MAKPQPIFSISNEQVEELLLAGDDISNEACVRRLEAANAFNPAHFARAREKMKLDAVRTIWRNFHDSEGMRTAISTVRKLDNGDIITGYVKKDNATLEDLQIAETDFWKRTNATWREALDLRLRAREKYGAQIGLPFEFERAKAKRAARAQRVSKQPNHRKQPEARI